MVDQSREALAAQPNWPCQQSCSSNDFCWGLYRDCAGVIASSTCPVWRALSGTTGTPAPAWQCQTSPIRRYTPQQVHKHMSDKPCPVRRLQLSRFISWYWRQFSTDNWICYWISDILAKYNIVSTERYIRSAIGIDSLCLCVSFEFMLGVLETTHHEAAAGLVTWQDRKLHNRR